jgi:MarR family transcriptional regulator, organic hydroperoxide resistance regulator
MDVRDEIKQTRPFRSKAQEAAVALLRTAHVLRRRFEAAAERDDITLQQYNVLRILRGARGPLPTMEIAGRMIEPTPGITRLVNTLEQRGLLKRERWAGDRRQVLCQISPTGLRLLEQLDEIMNELDDTSVGTLAADEIDILLRLLERIRLSEPI